MPEIVLHYIWQQGIARRFPQLTTDGRKVEILSVGHHNLDAGPDFADVHLRVWSADGLQYLDMVGNIEIHVSSSDWYAHHHDEDPAYDSIIMHIVRKADKPVYNSKGKWIDQIELTYPEDKDYVAQFLEQARAMDSALSTHPCGHRLLQDPSLITAHWKQTMLTRRLQCKQESIRRLLDLSHNDWQQAFYISLAHYFGFHTNGVPFELLAKQTPLPVLYKHRDNLFQIEAILLGQSGLLTADTADTPEQKSLLNEYRFLQTKFGLQPISGSLWKSARMRPQAQPKVRILQFAKLIHQSEFLLTQILDNREVDALRRLFAPAQMGKDSVDILLINVAAPFLYAKTHHKEALDLLEAIPPENNRIIRQWKILGQQVHHAADTQALIHLYQTCCESGKCFDCEVFTNFR